MRTSNFPVIYRADFIDLLYLRCLFRYSLNPFRSCCSDRRLPDAGKRSEREKRQITVEVSRSLKWASMMKTQEEEKKYFGPKVRVPTLVLFHFSRYILILLNSDNLILQYTILAATTRQCLVVTIRSLSIPF